MKQAFCLANFGGPRALNEISPFLQELLCDKDVVSTKYPQLIHSLLFRRIAKKRAIKIAKQYKKIGGKSPIYQDTEDYREVLAERLDGPLFTFHRYLPATHEKTLQKIHSLNFDTLTILPLFPQFTYATTGSIARFFEKKIAKHLLPKLRWIKSYPTHPLFVEAHQKKIQNFLEKEKIDEKDALFLFSAHGIPKSFLKKQDLYQYECTLSFQSVMKAFPKALGMLCFQSRFGPQEWLTPYTEDVVKNIYQFNQDREHVLIIPISFTSDHIETLYEVEEEYLPPIRKAGLKAYRIPALNKEPLWMDAIFNLFQSDNLCNTQMLVQRT